MLNRLEAKEDVVAVDATGFRFTQASAYNTRVDIDGIQEFCERIQENIENFSFEDKRKVIEILNVTALMRRGEGEAKLVLSGYFPSIELDAVDCET